MKVILVFYFVLLEIKENIKNYLYIFEDIYSCENIF